MDYYKFYKENGGKRVRVKMKDGDVFEGELNLHTSELDNEPDPESIVVGWTELFVNEINHIEVVS